jgi:hypothetical protein
MTKSSSKLILGLLLLVVVCYGSVIATSDHFDSNLEEKSVNLKSNLRSELLGADNGRELQAQCVRSGNLEDKCNTWWRKQSKREPNKTSCDDLIRRGYPCKWYVIDRTGPQAKCIGDGGCHNPTCGNLCPNMRCKLNCERHQYCLWDSITTSCSTDVTAIPASCAGSNTAVDPPRAPVNLRTAANYAILAASGVSTTGVTSVTGAVAVSPISSTAITGFGLVLDTLGRFSTSSLVTGRVYAPDYAAPTPGVLTQAVNDMMAAYTEAELRVNPDHVELGAGILAGNTLYGGLYKWSTGVSITADITLTGCASDVFIFQISQTLTLSSNINIILSGGVLPRNIFWQVAEDVTVGTGSTIRGNILGLTAIIFNTGSTGIGRALAQTAVTLDATTIN